MGFRTDDNAFLSVADPAALQAADRLSEKVIHERLDRWTWLVGPKFSAKERAAIKLSRDYSIHQVEYCRNFIFRRNAPLRKLFERSCEIGLLGMTADKVAQIFGFRKHRRLRGKFYSMLEKIDHGHHVRRAYAKDAVVRMYEKYLTFLRMEICVSPRVQMEDCPAASLATDSRSSKQVCRRFLSCCLPSTIQPLLVTTV